MNYICRDFYFSERKKLIIRQNNNEYFSHINEMKKDVPQGSMVDPLFFITYIKDLAEILGQSSTLVNRHSNTNIKSPELVTLYIPVYTIYKRLLPFFEPFFIEQLFICFDVLESSFISSY